MKAPHVQTMLAVLTSGCTSDQSGGESPPCYSLALSFETHPAPRSRKRRNLQRDCRCSRKAATDDRSAYRTRNNNRVDRQHPASLARPDRLFLSFRQKELAPEVFSSPALHSRWRPLAHYWKTGLAPLCQPNPMQTIQ